MITQNKDNRFRLPPVNSSKCGRRRLINETIDLFNVCIKKDYFAYDGKYYIQIEGLPMGSPISPIASDIFVNNFEEKMLSHNESRNILFWYRYVDDIIAKGTDRQLEKLSNFNNDIHTNIKFTTEIKENNKLNFWI